MWNALVNVGSRITIGMTISCGFEQCPHYGSDPIELMNYMNILVLNNRGTVIDNVQQFFDVSYEIMRQRQCSECSNLLQFTQRFCDFPDILFLTCEPSTDAEWSADRTFTVNNVEYEVGGVMYYGSRHFTSRFIDASGSIFEYDGMVKSGEFTIVEDIIDPFPSILRKSNTTSYNSIQAMIYKKK